MAGTVLGSNRKALYLLGLFIVGLLIQKGNAFEFKVGGPGGSWEVPSDPNTASFNQWAERNRFQIGDTLLFVYPADKDFVLHVTKDDYTSCNTAAPIDKFSDGHTVFKLNQSGPYYFISGVAENCHKNEKLVAVVMADRSNHTTKNSNETAPSSPPSPSAELSPSPAPAGEQPPSPPPSEENPAPAPSQESPPPPNGASAICSTVIGSIGALFGSWLLLL